MCRVPTRRATQTEIKDAAERHGVPERAGSAVIRVESGVQSPRGVAEGRARSDAAHAADRFDARRAQLRSIRSENIDGGVRHLRGLIDRFRNNLPLALAAYNAGEKAVVSHRGIPPYPETQGLRDTGALSL